MILVSGQRKYSLPLTVCKYINWVAVKPARAQVLITEPLKILISRELFIWIGAIIILEILETEYYWVVVGI
jgi:hypothetical protein